MQQTHEAASWIFEKSFFSGLTSVNIIVVKYVMDQITSRDDLTRKILHHSIVFEMILWWLHQLTGLCGCVRDDKWKIKPHIIFPPSLEITHKSQNRRVFRSRQHVVAPGYPHGIIPLYGPAPQHAFSQSRSSPGNWGAHNLGRLDMKPTENLDAAFHTKTINLFMNTSRAATIFEVYFKKAYSNKPERTKMESNEVSGDIIIWLSGPQWLQ